MIKVLIVEDEKITREYIKYVIKEYQLDFELLEASNGLEAIKLSRVFKPDLIIIDIHMAEMDGLESSKILKDELPDVKIIILTAYDQFDYAQQAVKIQINDYLLKPISPEDLVEAIERVLKKEIPIKEKNMMDKDLKKSSDVNVNKAIEYISKNYCNKIYLKDVASHVGYSDSYFSKLFKKETNTRFSDYLSKYRIEQSKLLMSDFQLSLGEIANKIGFEDFSYYSNVFSKHEGMMPSEYRKNVKK